MNRIFSESLMVWWPEVILSFGALAVLLLGVFTQRTASLIRLTWVILLASALALTRVPVFPKAATFFGLILCDPLSLSLRWMALLATAIVVLLIMGSREVEDALRGEYLCLVLLIGLGLMLMGWVVRGRRAS